MKKLVTAMHEGHVTCNLIAIDQAQIDHDHFFVNFYFNLYILFRYLDIVARQRISGSSESETSLSKVSPK